MNMYSKSAFKEKKRRFSRGKNRYIKHNVVKNYTYIPTLLEVC